MRLKDYQTEVLDSLSGFLRVLEAKRREAEEFVAFQQSKGRDARLADYCRETWDALNTEGRLPRARDRQGHEVALPYVPRHDGLGRPVPNYLPTSAKGDSRLCDLAYWIVSDALGRVNRRTERQRPRTEGVPHQCPIVRTGLSPVCGQCSTRRGCSGAVPGAGRPPPGSRSGAVPLP